MLANDRRRPGIAPGPNGRAVLFGVSTSMVRTEPQAAAPENPRENRRCSTGSRLQAQQRGYTLRNTLPVALKIFAVRMRMPLAISRAFVPASNAPLAPMLDICKARPVFGVKCARTAFAAKTRAHGATRCKVGAVARRARPCKHPDTSCIRSYGAAQHSARRQRKCSPPKPFAIW